MVDLGWKSVGVLELTALPSIDDERWKPLVLDGGPGNSLAAAEKWASTLSHPAPQSTARPPSA